jgi:hypothetical protein
VPLPVGTTGTTHTIASCIMQNVIFSAGRSATVSIGAIIPAFEASFN